MPEMKINARIQNKYKTLEEWNLISKGDFIPLKGEVCYAVNDNLVYQKIGDGVTDFVDLQWLQSPGAQADYAEMDSSKPTFIKNRLGDILTSSMDLEHKNNQPFKGSFQVKSILPVIKRCYFDETFTKIENYLNPNIFQSVKTCQVTINDVVYPNCPVFWYGSLSTNINYVAQGIREECYIGNPKFISEMWNALNPDPSTMELVEEEDNGLPFLISFNMYDENPIGSNIQTDLEFKKGDIVDITIQVDRSKLLIKNTPRHYLPMENQGIIYDVSKNAIFSRAAYQATGANSAAFGQATNAQGANQFVIGQYNNCNTEDLFIVGNGTADDNLSNAFTVDKAGNARATSLILTSPNGTEFKISVNDDGNIITEDKDGNTIVNAFSIQPNSNGNNSLVIGGI